MSNPIYQAPKLRLEVNFPDDARSSSVVVELNDGPVDPVDVGRMVAGIVAGVSKPQAFDNGGRLPIGTIVTSNASGSVEGVQYR